MERDYKSGQIEVTSYPSGRRWRPVVIVSKQIGGCIQIKNLRTPSDWLFDTEEKSDEEGYQLGAAWIDRQEQ